MSQPGRVDHQPGFILMTQPWRETSLLVEVLTRTHGRLTLIARSARRPQSVLRGVLMPFSPLEISWFGKGELRTLHNADWLGGTPQLSGIALLSGFYLNELIIRLTTRDDPHSGIYDAYQKAVFSLAKSRKFSVVLRRFELVLLTELGYGPTLDSDDQGKPVEENGWYRCPPGQLPSRSVQGPDAVLGTTLLALAADDFSDAKTRRAARRLTRQWLEHLLPDDGKLATRELLQSIGLTAD